MNRPVLSGVLLAATAAAFMLPACASASGAEEIDATEARDTQLSVRGRADAGNASDGTPTRVPCASTFGSGLSGTFGRLDGTIVAVVPNGHGSCNADRNHVHVQVLSGGQTYDVAVNTDGGFIAQRDTPLPGAPWSDGWHRGGSFDYVADLGLHLADFKTGTEPELEQQLEDALANANHVSIFATLYSHGGVHLVHRRGNNVDGAVVLDPLSPTAHVLAFHFSDQTF